VSRWRAALLDGLGTLLRLEPPAAPLRRELHRRFGLRVDEEAARRALGAEMAYYREHILDGRDVQSLEGLRTRCAGVLREGLALDEVHEALLASLRFRPYPEVPAALGALRAEAMRLVVVSNWDVSLHDRLAEAGIAEWLDGAVTAAEVGVAKPDPAPFERGLQLAGTPAAQALHAGDSLVEDVEGARAAGIEPVLVRRDGTRPSPGAGVRVIQSLAELAALADTR
jgi:putative hydrolase of the HAD superfamily